MKPARWTEVAFWAVGIVLLSSYAALRVAAERDRSEGVRAFQALRHVARAPASAGHLARAPTSAARLQISLADLDQSLWSRARVQAFRRTNSDAAPEGILRVPALGLIVPIYPGTAAAALDRGAGHIAGTAPLDSSGNAAIAGHRDGFFRPLSRIKPGQTLYVETLGGTRRYRVTEIRIVAPSDVSVLAPTAHPSITLVTCYPFHFVGPAPRRFVVRAELFHSRHAAVVRTAHLSQHQE